MVWFLTTITTNVSTLRKAQTIGKYNMNADQFSKFAISANAGTPAQTTPSVPTAATLTALAPRQQAVHVAQVLPSLS